jgi:signal transduction histidine kinase
MSLTQAPPLRVPSLAYFPWTARNRLARDLHDGVGESINSLLVQIRLAMAHGEAGLDDLRVLEEEAVKALHSVRSLAYGARRRSASDPLEEARLYSEHVLMASGAQLSWIDERMGLRLTRKVVKQLAWSVRESVTNAARHANARIVVVRLSQSDQRVHVSIRDDGVGFSPEGIRPTSDGRGLGLLGNAERMADIGGFFNVRSSPGNGTLVLLEAPLLLRHSSAARPFAAPEFKPALPEEQRIPASTAV